VRVALFYRFSGAPGVAKGSKVEISRTARARPCGGLELHDGRVSPPQRGTADFSR